MTFWSSEGRAKLAWAIPNVSDLSKIDAKHNNQQ